MIEIDKESQIGKERERKKREREKERERKREKKRERKKERKRKTERERERERKREGKFLVWQVKTKKTGNYANKQMLQYRSISEADKQCR